MFKTFRTSRGFGVHSPFAFNLITRVLREKDGYYPYERIETFLASEGFTSIRDINISRLLMRLVLYFKPKEIKLVGEVAKGLDPIVKLASANLDKTRNYSRLLFLSGRDLNHDEVRCEIGETPDDRRVILADKREIMPEVWTELENLTSTRSSGMVFISSKGLMLWVGNVQLPAQDFKLTF